MCSNFNAELHISPILPITLTGHLFRTYVPSDENWYIICRQDIKKASYYACTQRLNDAEKGKKSPRLDRQGYFMRIRKKKDDSGSAGVNFFMWVVAVVTSAE